MRAVASRLHTNRCLLMRRGRRAGQRLAKQPGNALSTGNWFNPSIAHKLHSSSEAISEPRSGPRELHVNWFTRAAAAVQARCSWCSSSWARSSNTQPRRLLSPPMSSNAQGCTPRTDSAMPVLQSGLRDVDRDDVVVTNRAAGARVGTDHRPVRCDPDRLVLWVGRGQLYAGDSKVLKLTLDAASVLTK